MMSRYFLSPLIFVVCILITLFPPNQISGKSPVGIAERVEQIINPTWSTPWVDSVFTSLSLEQRIAQLLMIRVHTDKDAAYYREQERLIKRYNIGGVAFFRGGPIRQVQLTNRLQEAAQTPLLIAMDAEWGPSMRLDSTIVFPRQMTLGAISNDSIIYQFGMEVGRQLKRLGVHINFAPVVDVNNNPDNPVINFRAFGESRYNVARKGIAYMRGMQDVGILACAKHFPGHGDTDADSHYTLPVLNHSFEEIDSIHLFPFKELIRSGLHSVMVAHLQIPVLEPGKNVASTLSKNIVTDLLKNELGFSGLVITDALDMRGVSDHFKPGDLEVQSFLAGNDILLLPENVPAAIEAIKRAIRNGIIQEADLNEVCKKILFYKQVAGLNTPHTVSEDGLIADLNTYHAEQLNKRLAHASITLIKNDGDVLPLKESTTEKAAYLSIGAPTGNHFHSMLEAYKNLPQYSIHKSHNASEASSLIKSIIQYETIVISVHNNSMFPTRQYGINQETVDLISNIAKKKEVILTLFANPYSLLYFKENILDIDAILVAWQDGLNFEEAAAQVIFGGRQAMGSLPVGIYPYFPPYTGLDTPSNYRIGFGIPEEVGIYSSLLNRVDSIALAGIEEKAYPGCQIVLVKDGIVFYNKSFGTHTYGHSQPVNNSDVYDLASLTKILATSAAVMHMSDRGLINVDLPISHYLPWLAGSNKEHIKLREMMAHQASLQAWIPFYIETLTERNLNPIYYNNLLSPDYPTEVAGNLYIHKNYRDSIFSKILLSPLRNNRNYLYSDLGYILLAEIIESQSGMALDEYAESVFYRPMGLSSLGFRPLRNHQRERIVPTENDTIFRRQLLRGHVHDPAAAMLGGVSGHAGLFGNALDVAIMMQLFLQGGEYGGTRYIDEATVREFTRVQFPGNKNRRGLGFDKPDIQRTNNNHVAKSASPNSYGHSGFTGTYTWADPKENLVYVFISNRVYPDSNNRKISTLNIRTDIHEAVYEAIRKSRTTIQ